MMDYAQGFQIIRAMQSLQRAMDYLHYQGLQWERGEAAAARDDAIAILRGRYRALDFEYRNLAGNSLLPPLGIRIAE